MESKIVNGKVYKYFEDKRAGSIRVGYRIGRGIFGFYGISKWFLSGKLMKFDQHKEKFQHGVLIWMEYK
jgi:hypothetical protein